MKLGLTKLALPLAFAALTAGACAAPDRPANGRGGVDFTPEEVLAGAELGALDSCDACCDPEHYLPWCDGGSGGGTGGGSGIPSPQPGCGQSCYWSGSSWVCYDHCPGDGGEGSWP